MKNKFTAYGFDAQYDSFPYIVSYDRNVIARLMGGNGIGDEIIISGHYDSATPTCPGADDNASGTAVAVEVARIMKNQSWPVTVTCAGWGAEEFGLWGSKHYAEWADSTDRNIKAMLNFDMVGYMNSSEQDVQLGGVSWLMQLYQQVAQLYASPLVIAYLDIYNNGVSDDSRFFDLGFSSLGCIEYPHPGGLDGYPYYHTDEDLLIHLSPELYTSIAKAAVAVTACLELYPAAIEITVCDVGTGSQLMVSWTPAATDSTVDGYWIFWGTTSGNYSDSLWIEGRMAASYTIDGLMTDTTYYIITRAASGVYQSLTAIEATGTPKAFPLIPSGLAAAPVDSGIRLSWDKNLELDLAGYNVYRRIDGGTFDSLTYTSDTFLLEKPLSGASRYYYKLKARDADGNY
ncbi:MAG: M20/M25/M40 family metallo-hydrolase, partial [Methanoregula sp.]|nr:M20/M25/M40 family metallo-hydrolase [Methanoregula sp.]